MTHGRVVGAWQEREHEFAFLCLCASVVDVVIENSPLRKDASPPNHVPA
jgi:hypothetical protein